MLQLLLSPRSIAIVGASADANKVNGRPVRNLLRDGYSGRIHLVNPSVTEIAGLPCYRDVASIPETPDLGVVAVAAERAVQAVHDLGAKGVKMTIVWSAGFGESGERGRRLESALLEAARGYGMRLCGPNTLGLTNAFERMPLTFSQYADAPLASGPVGFVSQSGAFGTAVATAARSRRIGLGYFVSTGNQVDLTVADVLEEILDDDRIRVAVAYLEGLRDGLKFVSVAEKALRLGKPLIVVKVGKEAAGRRAAVSHTGSLAGDDAVFDSVIRQFGVLRAVDETHALDLAAALVSCPPARHDGVGLITISGGAGAMMADLAEEMRLQVPVLGEATQMALGSVLRGFASAVNPVDVTGQAIEDISILKRSLAIVADDPSVAITVVWIQLLHGKAAQVVELMAQARRSQAKPFVLCWLNAPPESVAQLRNAGICVTETTRGAIQAAAGLIEFGRSVAQRPASIEPPVRPEPLAAHGAATEPVPSIEAAALLAKAALVLAQARLARSADEAVSCAAELGYPVALKIESADLPHKTEADGVRLALADGASVRAAFDSVMASARRYLPQARVAGVLVQRMAKPGTELVLGLRRDPVFGPTVMVGLGGVFIEVLNDVAFGVPPIAREAAIAMIGRLRFRKVFDGVRGKPPVDMDALAEAVGALSRLAQDHPEIVELDLNPVFASDNVVTAVDWLMVRDING